MELRKDIGVGIVAALLWALMVPASATADDGGNERPTLQERYASKDGRLYGHLGATMIVRDDFYRSLGYGLDAGYYVNETIGFELRAHNLHTGLTHTGDQMRRDYELVPDMRAPTAAFGAGTRISWGYGKVLTLGDFVVHFDPQFITHAGITLAEERVVPTATIGAGFLTHWQFGIQVKLDLQMSLHIEQRDRGIVPATGFAPVLSVGWSPQWRWGGES